MKFKKAISLWFTGILTCTSFLAQESFNSSGGNATGIGGSASYSLGQITYQYITGSSGSVSQGVQQTYEIIVVNRIEEAKGINLSITTYPNPTNDILTIDVNESAKFISQKLMYQIFDMQGKLLQHNKITDNKSVIDMSNLISATYHLVIIHKQSIATFIIIKK